MPVDEETGEAVLSATVLRVMAEIDARSTLVAVAAVRDAIDRAAPERGDAPPDRRGICAELTGFEPATFTLTG